MFLSCFINVTQSFVLFFPKEPTINKGKSVKLIYIIKKSSDLSVFISYILWIESRNFYSFPSTYVIYSPHYLLNLAPLSVRNANLYLVHLTRLFYMYGNVTCNLFVDLCSTLHSFNITINKIYF